MELKDQKMDVELELNEHGFGSVKLNGEDVSWRTEEVSVSSKAGQRLTVQLTVLPTSLKIKATGHVSETEARGTDDPQEQARQALLFAVSGQATDSKKADILWEAMRGLEGAETGFLFRQLYDEWLRRRY